MLRTAARTATGPTLALLLAAAAAALGCREPVVADGAGLSLVGVDGVPVRPLAEPHPPATVFLFVRTHCPITNRYAPEVRRLHEAFSARGVAFWLVYPDPATTPDEIRAHVAEYSWSMPALRDPAHELVAHVGARITPEAAVFDAAGRLVYRGRIDDRWADLGRARREARTHDLARALDAVLAGRAVEVARTEAVGCFIADLR
jgi:hypothetical protein